MPGMYEKLASARGARSFPSLACRVLGRRQMKSGEAGSGIFGYFRFLALVLCALSIAGFALAALATLAVQLGVASFFLRNVTLGLFLAGFPLGIMVAIVRFALVCADNRCGPWDLVTKTYNRSETGTPKIITRPAPSWLNKMILLVGLYDATIFGLFVFRNFPNSSATLTDEISLISGFSALFLLWIAMTAFAYTSN